MSTGAFLWGIGDVVAQIIPTVFFQDENSETNVGGNKGTEVSTTKSKPFIYDYARTGRAVAFGFAIHAPLAHVHYNFLEWMTVQAGITGLRIPVFKAFMEQVSFLFWVY